MADQLDPALVAQISEQLRRSMGGALVQVGNDLTKLDRISKDVVSSSGGIGKLDSAFMGLTTRMLGPIGLVAGLYQVSNALSNVAAQSVQLQAFSRNTGIAADNIQNMQLQLQMMGKSSEEAKATVGQLAGLLNDFNTNRQGSSLSQTLLGREGGAAVIRDLNAAKNVTEQIAVMLKTYQNQPTERQRRGVAEAFGMDPASMEQLIKDQNLVALTFKANEEALEKYHRASVIFTNNIDQAYKAMSGHVVAALNDIMGGAEDSQKTFATVVKGFTDAVDTLFNGRSFGSDFWESKFNFGGLKQDIKDVKDFFQWFTSLPNVGEDKKFRFLPGLTGGAYPQGDDPMGADYTNQSKATSPWQMRGKLPAFDLRRGGTSGSTDFGGMRRQDSIEEEQTSTLVDIRDTLKRMEERGGEAGSGGTGGGRGALSRKLGMYNGTGGDSSESSGSGGSGAGTRGDRNNNPGNMKMGPLAKAFGAVGADDKGFAIFPDALSGAEAHSALVKSDKYKGLTLDQFGNKYSEGSADWKRTVGKSLGIGPNDIVDNQDPRLIDAIKRAEGTGRVGISAEALRGDGKGSSLDPRRMDPMAPAGSGLEKDTSVVTAPSGAKFRVKSEFAPNFQRFVNDYEAEGGKIGPNSGGLSGRPGNASYHPLGRAIDVNQVGYGIRGGGKLLPEEKENELAERAGLYPGAKFGSRSDRGHFEVRNGALALARQREWAEQEQLSAARARMDSAKNSGTDNTLKATVDFNNVPPGVKTNVESEGEIFKDLQVNKSKQGEVAPGSPGQPFAGVW